jgi:transcriptional regulator with XRE-family HTH domain
MASHIDLSTGLHNGIPQQFRSMNLATRIKQAMAAKGWELPDLSRESKVPYPTLAGILGGHQKTSTKTPQIAAALGVSALWLATGTGPREIQRTELNDQQRPGNLGHLSQTLISDDLILAAAEKWVMFEEAPDRFQPVRRLERLMELVQLIKADGGSLSPEHASEIIEAKRKQLEGAKPHGRSKERGRNHGKH